MSWDSRVRPSPADWGGQVHLKSSPPPPPPCLELRSWMWGLGWCFQSGVCSHHDLLTPDLICRRLKLKKYDNLKPEIHWSIVTDLTENVSSYDVFIKSEKLYKIETIYLNSRCLYRYLFSRTRPERLGEKI